MFNKWKLKREIQAKIDLQEMPDKSIRKCENCKYFKVKHSDFGGRRNICKLGALRINVSNVNCVNKCEYYKNKYGYEVKEYNK